MLFGNQNVLTGKVQRRQLKKGDTKYENNYFSAIPLHQQVSRASNHTRFSERIG
ncbi:MAG: hypothetical protein ACOX4V_07625 [Anaerovoracaceae bacterium]|jgi:hypothetical protein|nr:hypothetical protein [Clostridiales bacterium]